MTDNLQIQSGSLEQRQQQQLSLRQRQALELLHLPAQELEERLTRELEANPLLEELPIAAEAVSVSETSGSSADSGDESEVDETMIEQYSWGDELPSSRGDGASQEAEENDFDGVSALDGDSGWESDFPMRDEERGDRDLDRAAISAAPGQSLTEELHGELATRRVSPRLAELAGGIIDSLDDKGYLRTPTADLAMVYDADPDEIDEALKLVQSFDPPGIGARDLGECLLLQLRRADKLTPLLEQVISSGLDDIADNRLPALAKRLGVTVPELNTAISELRKLDPRPGERAGSGPAAEVIPEIEIYRKDGEYLVRPLREYRRRIGINRRYQRMLEGGAGTLSAEDRAYLREKLRAAQELQRALDERGTTLERLGRVIASAQRDFLDRGISALKPLTMKQAGEMLGLHETTVSRAAADKYVKTPQGVFPFRFFFSSGYDSAGGSGEAVSNRAVMERIRKLIEAEDPAHPLSDGRIAELLNEEKIPIARRTVAKYRESMKLPPTSLRRRHG